MTNFTDFTAITWCWLALLAAALLTMHLKLKLIRRGFESSLRILDDDISAQFDGVHECLRMQHLEIMKALKGDSYVGQLGGIDVHTDPIIPTDHILLRSRTLPGALINELQDQAESYKRENDERC